MNLGLNLKVFMPGYYNSLMLISRDAENDKGRHHSAHLKVLIVLILTQVLSENASLLCCIKIQSHK